MNPNGTIFNRTRQYLAYVDDVVILGRSVRAIEEVLTQLKDGAQETGLIINENKTKYMKITKSGSNIESEILLDGQRFEEVKSFKYLGSTIT